MDLVGVLRRRRWLLAAAVAVLAGLVGLLAAVSANDPPCRRTLVPAYVQPGDLARAAADARPIVFNPDNGPGDAAQASYRRAVAAARRAGARVLGYVATGYAARDAAAVRRDVDRYATWYGVDDIFLDEASARPDDLPHYRGLARQVPGTVVLNPGVVPAREYFDLADVVVIYEGPFADYATKLRRMPGWLNDVPHERIAHLIYGASREQALEAVRMNARAGYLYATDGTLPNPWGTVPAYLAEEESALGGCG